MHHLRNGSESSRIIRRYDSGSLPIIAPAGTLRLNEVVQMAMWPAFLFVFVLAMQIQQLRFNYAWITNTFTVLAVVVVLLWPFAAVFIYILGIWKTVQNSVARFSSVLFWTYWPTMRLLACLVAAFVAWSIGDQLWYNNFRPYEEYYRLQSYDNVDSYSISGSRLQDAGLVRFNASDGVDRSKASCIVNERTYCIAPIVRGGVVQPGVSQTKTGTQDLFMAGIDCCNCPVTDFRCGEWEDATSGKLGGMRLFDDADNRMFRLAADKWGANNGQSFVHGVFFNWTNEPVEAWKNLWSRGMLLAILSCVLAVFGSVLIMVILNGFMLLLKRLQIAAPLDESTPILPGLVFGRETPKKGYIPDEYRNYLTQQDPTGAVDAKM